MRRHTIPHRPRPDHTRADHARADHTRQGTTSGHLTEALALGLRAALHGAHSPTSSSLSDFRRSCLVSDVQSVYQQFLRMRRDILACLVWEEFSLLGPFRNRLPQSGPLGAVTAELKSHRELRAALTAIARLLKSRQADRTLDQRVVEQVDQLELLLAAHSSGMQEHLCPALENILTAAEQAAVIHSLRGIAPQRRD